MSPTLIGRYCLLAMAAFASMIVPLGIAKDPPANDVLRIGSIGTNGSEKESRESGAFETLETFIKEEAGLTSTITQYKDWRALLDKIDKGEVRIGVFQGHEFAWAQSQQPKLKPLAVGINTNRYRVACVIASKKNPATKFADLRGQAISVPVQGHRLLRMYADAEARKAGEALPKFFSKVVTGQGAEDALDDTVDGVIQAAVVDRAAFDSFKRRKSGRFEQLKEITSSQPLPPPVIAYQADKLDNTTRQKFEQGILGAHRKESGQNMLSLFHLTSFELAPSDFSAVLEATCKTYPVPAN